MRDHLVEMREMVLNFFLIRSMKVRRKMTTANEKEVNVEELFSAHQ